MGIVRVNEPPGVMKVAPGAMKVATGALKARLVKVKLSLDGWL